MEPIGVARRFFGLAPFRKHQRRNAFQFGILFRLANVAGKFKPVAIGVKEIDRPEYAVKCWAYNINALRLDMRLSRQQRVEIRHLKRNMLHPRGCIGVFTHIGLVGQFEECDDIAATAIKENMRSRLADE